MLRMLIARLVIGGAAVCAGGGVAGIGLANYVESGSFHFYKQPRMAEWRDPGADAAAPQMLAFSEVMPDPAPAFVGVDAER